MHQAINIANMANQVKAIVRQYPTTLHIDTNNSINKAAYFCVSASNALGLTRSDKTTPAWYHQYWAVEVGKLFGLAPGDLTILWLHDIVEDTGWTHEQIFQHFSGYVAKGVKALTHEKPEGMVRCEWIALYHQQLADSIDTYQTIKLIESMTNLCTILDGSKKQKFAKVWLAEQVQLHTKLVKAHPVVRDVYHHLLSETLDRYNELVNQAA
ncbi:metal-dependent phosphohydrolase [Pseudomonas phage PhiPA3]|uniref:Uncharacterized protein 301 n=1 Tax=Pseudomonas phage PhiPA3 TaxID=998086 RepID=F8SJD7_BPPA3|nr:metal-dependent phosphohydrolase [Pseudomonas phage PhiPA3]AEH03724.1 hypothetical protein [Pseudomonas phage PhiPA3]